MKARDPWLRVAGLACAAVSIGALTAPRASGEELSRSALREILAPAGTLRIGVYPGSPTSLVRDGAGEVHGIAVEIGRELARSLDLPASLVEFPRAAAVVDAVASGAVDVTVTNASPARAERVAFTEPLLALELGFLVPAGSGIAVSSDLDARDKRVGVTQGSTSEHTLSRVLPNAAIVPIPTMERVAASLREHLVDAYATNKSVLFEMSDGLPGSRILDGRWGLEHLAIAYPKGRDAASPYLTAFVRDARATGLLAAASGRAGLRGQAEAETPP